MFKLNYAIIIIIAVGLLITAIKINILNMEASMELKYKRVDENFIEDFKEKIALAEEKIEKLLELENKTYDNFFDKTEHILDEIEIFTFPLGIEISADITELGKKLYGEFLPIINNFMTKLNQNEKMANAVIKIYEEENLSDVRKRILEKRILDFKSNGIGLPKKEKEKIKEINLKLSELSNDFNQNVTDATNAYELIIEDKKVLEEFSEVDKKTAEIEENKWKFTLHGPSLNTFLTYCNDKTLREEIYKASSTKALENEDLIEEILKLRDEKAKILGYPNYREFSIASKTANNADEVIEFLTKLGKTALPKAKEEIRELEEFAKITFGYEKVEIFDYSYLSRKLKEAKYSFNPNEVKPYFEQNQVVNGMFKFLEDTFNLKAEKVEDLKVWNEKAKVFKLERNGEVLGNLIMDLEAGETKRGGAWANKWTTSYYKDGKRIPATGIVICNFPPSREGVPSLLSHDNVVTLFHEMGHALHLITSKVEEISASGFNGTEWDVVEYPSQWLQEFANNKEVIKSFGKHYETGEVIPDELIDKMLKSENYGQGYQNNRQIEFGLFDMMIYDKPYSKEEVQKILDGVRDMVSPIKPPVYNKFQCSFSHIFGGGYAAGYYSYKWAEVLSADSYLEMTKGGKINKELANNFFDNLLSLGGSVNMKESFVKVHNRQPDPKALLKLTGIL